MSIRYGYFKQEKDMAIKKVRKIGDPVLRETSKAVEKIGKSIPDLVRDMIDTLGDEEGVGLAAPQIGISKRVIIIRYENEIGTYINPEVEAIGNEMVEDGEGCLSIYSIQGFQVNRFQKVKVRATDLKGKPVKLIAEDLLARIFQHEVDHLNGKMFIDHLDADPRMELLKKISEIKS